MRGEEVTVGGGRGVGGVGGVLPGGSLLSTTHLALDPIQYMMPFLSKSDTLLKVSGVCSSRATRTK